MFQPQGGISSSAKRQKVGEPVCTYCQQQKSYPQFLNKTRCEEQKKLFVFYLSVWSVFLTTLPALWPSSVIITHNEKKYGSACFNVPVAEASSASVSKTTHCAKPLVLCWNAFRHKLCGCLDSRAGQRRDLDKWWNCRKKDGSRYIRASLDTRMDSQLCCKRPLSQLGTWVSLENYLNAWKHTDSCNIIVYYTDLGICNVFLFQEVII